MFNLFKSDDSTSLQKELMKDYINEDKIQKLIDSGLDINATDEKGKTLLFELVHKRKIEGVKILLKNGVNIDHEDSLGKTPLSIAASNADGMMIRFLLEKKASLNYINSSGRILIQDIALEGNLKVFQLLLAHGADLTFRDTYGKTVLFDAIEGGNIRIVREILNSIDDVNVADNEGQTALFSAALKDDQTIMKYLIEYGLDTNHLDDNKRNVLFKVVLKGASHLDTLDALLEKDINVNQKDIEQKTILDEILKIFNILRENDLDKYRQTDYKYVKKENDYQKLLTILIDNGLDIDKKDEEGKSILFHAVNNKDFEAIEFLLNAGANINVEDKDGKTILFQECLKGYQNYEMLDYLFEKGIDIDHQDYEERTIVDDLVEMILIQDNGKRASSRRFLDIVENGEYFRLLKRLIIKRPKLNQSKSDGKTILFDIIHYNNMELTKVFLNNGADINKIDNEGNTPLSCMIDEGLKAKTKKERQEFLERVVFMLKFRVDVNITDKDGRTIFHKAVIADDYELVEKLLSKKTDLNIKDKQGRTVLHHTQWKGNYKIARLLISAGADMNEPDFAGFTILNYAAILGHAKLVMVLISSGVLMYNRAKKSKAVAAFFKEKEDNLVKLVENNITDEKMRNALQQVADNLKKEVAEALK
ncbi:ankyrin repeat domain-containing protein [Arcobacter sp.]|uniref:ankyrin repeat domain-containing protein n=1 Tax=Arcobacter sp. TaxID=1872629 RepID=UPI003D1173DC